MSMNFIPKDRQIYEESNLFSFIPINKPLLISFISASRQIYKLMKEWKVKEWTNEMIYWEF
jgi:hypothetical protein